MLEKMPISEKKYTPPSLPLPPPLTPPRAGGGALRVAVGMSGGVDSSVSALLLKQQGYDVVGLFMKLWHDPCGTGENACCDEKAEADAKRVADQLGIPFYVVDARKEFKSAVTDYFIDEYKNLRTPNPCVVCNKKIKFGWMLEFAQKIGCDYLATGHYAQTLCHFDSSKRVEKSFERSLDCARDDNSKSIFRLFEGKDSNKDQSYFLYRLNQDQLSKIIFPVGGMTKQEVRALAKKNGLPVYEKKESQEICFVEDDYRDFLKHNLSEEAFKSGEIVDKEGDIIGRHNGLLNYTIGQRKGINQLKAKSGKQKVETKPLYATGFDIEKNQLIVGSDKELFKTEFEVEDVHWIGAECGMWNVECRMDNVKVKVRYKAEEIPCTIVKLQDSILKILLEQPARAVTPGQSAVFYSGDEVLGGGIIV